MIKRVGLVVQTPKKTFKLLASDPLNLYDEDLSCGDFLNVENKL